MGQTTHIGWRWGLNGSIEVSTGLAWIQNHVNNSKTSCCRCAVILAHLKKKHLPLFYQEPLNCWLYFEIAESTFKTHLAVVQYPPKLEPLHYATTAHEWMWKLASVKLQAFKVLLWLQSWEKNDSVHFEIPCPLPYYHRIIIKSFLNPLPSSILPQNHYQVSNPF